MSGATTAKAAAIGAEADPEALAMAARLVRQCEGCVLHPYQDSANVWTIGVGSIRMPNGSPVTANTPPITQEQADDMMMAELAPTAARVDAMIPTAATIGQRAALYSFAYNEGTGALHGSTLLRRFIAGDLVAAVAQFQQWVYAGGKVVKGLQNRRALEASVFEGKVIP